MSSPSLRAARVGESESSLEAMTGVREARPRSKVQRAGKTKEGSERGPGVACLSVAVRGSALYNQCSSCFYLVA